MPRIICGEGISAWWLPGRCAMRGTLDLREIAVDRVVLRRELVARAANLGADSAVTGRAPTSTVRLQPLTIDDCRVSVFGLGSGRRGTQRSTDRFSSWSEVKVEGADCSAEVPRCAVILVQHAMAAVQRRFSGHPEDWSEPLGAVATTSSARFAQPHW